MPLGINNRFFYGWVIVAVGTLSMFVQGSLWSPVLSVFFHPLAEDFGWNRTQLSGAVTVGTLGSGFAAAVTGHIVDKHGPRMLLVVTAFLLGVSFWGLSWVHSLWHFYLAYSVGRVITAGPMWLGAAAMVSNWFVLRRGKAMGINFLGGYMGLAIWPILARLSINLWGWRVAFQILGVAVWALLIIPAAIFVRRRPEDMGLTPDGVTQVGQSAEVFQQDRVPEVDEGLTLQSALRTRSFWFLNAAGCFMGLSMGGINLHQVPYMIDVGLHPNVAVVVLGAFALVGALASLIWGLVTDRIPMHYALAIGFFLATLGVFLLLGVRNLGVGYIYAAIYGFAVGGLPIAFAVAWAQYFGRRHVGSIMGFATPFQAGTLAFGALFGGWVVDTLGTYQIAFLVYAASFFAGGVLAFFARAPLENGA